MEEEPDKETISIELNSFGEFPRSKLITIAREKKNNAVRVLLIMDPPLILNPPTTGQERRTKFGNGATKTQVGPII